MATATPAPLLSPNEQALADFNREQEDRGLAETLAELKQVAGRTRTKTGTIKHARFLAGVLALRFEGKGPTETARVLGCSVERVKRALQQVREDHSIDRLLDRVDQVILPLAIDNAADGVMNRDKDYTLEVLRGRGIFRTHKSIEAQVKQTVLTLTVQMDLPDHLKGLPVPEPRVGAIVGAPVAAAADAGPAPKGDPVPVTIQTPAGETVAVTRASVERL